MNMEELLFLGICFEKFRNSLDFGLDRFKLNFIFGICYVIKFGLYFFCFGFFIYEEE